MPGRCLVVFFSRSGTTRAVAEALSTILESDIEEITEGKSREGFLGYLDSLVEGIERRPSRTARWSRDPAAYGLVLIGTPVWVWSLSAPVRAYLMANRGRFRKVAFFCTHETTGSESVFTQMERLVGKAPQAVCAFTTSDVNADEFGPQLLAFATTVEQALPPLRREDTPRDTPPCEPENGL